MIKVQRSLPQNILLVIALVLVFTSIGKQIFPFLGVQLIPESFAIYVAGIAITALGLGRYGLGSRPGSNWSSIPALRKGHKLIRTGPYSLVRHPIYIGLTFRIIGSAPAPDCKLESWQLHA